MNKWEGSEYQKLHKKLWNWLAKNPGKEKDDWPEWKDIEEKNDAKCFACEYAHEVKKQAKEDIMICNYCPLYRATGLACFATGSLYQRWSVQTKEGNLHRAVYYAEQIRDAI